MRKNLTIYKAIKRGDYLLYPTKWLNFEAKEDNTLATIEEVEYVESCIDSLASKYPDVNIHLILSNGQCVDFRLDDCMCYPNNHGGLVVDIGR